MRVDQVSYGVAVASAIVCFVGVGLGIHTMAITGAVGTVAFAVLGKFKASNDKYHANAEYYKLVSPEELKKCRTLSERVVHEQAEEVEAAREEGQEPRTIEWREVIADLRAKKANIAATIKTQEQLQAEQEYPSLIGSENLPYHPTLDDAVACYQQHEAEQAVREQRPVRIIDWREGVRRLTADKERRNKPKALKKQNAAARA